MSNPLKIFVTYAHKNTEEKEELITHLAVMKQEGLISIWHDNEILPGDKWRDAIFDNLADSDLLLYLVSAYSLASGNCNKELAAALNVEIRVIPIILENCDWLNHQLSDFQALPEKGLPITKWEDHTDGWKNVMEGIRKVVNEMHLREDSSSELSEKELRSELAFQFGNVLMMFGQLDIAIKAYSDAIDLNPHYANAYNNRGAVYGKKHQFNEAIADFNRAMELDTDHAGAYYNRGTTYIEKGEFDKAIADFNKATQLKPDYAKLIVVVALLMARQASLTRQLQTLVKPYNSNPTLPMPITIAEVLIGKRANLTKLSKI